MQALSHADAPHIVAYITKLDTENVYDGVVLTAITVEPVLRSLCARVASVGRLAKQCRFFHVLAKAVGSTEFEAMQMFVITAKYQVNGRGKVCKF